MVHLRIVAPPDQAEKALELLCGTESVCNVIHLPGAAQRPHGDVILCDVAREDASVVLSDLKELRIHETGSIALEEIDTQISDMAEQAELHAKGAPADAVVWEEVEQRTSESVELSAVFLLFIVLAALIATVGIFLDQPILIVGAMVVGPEFGPLAGFCVAAVSRRRSLAARSFVALAVGFPLAITATYLAAHAFKATGLAPDVFSSSDHSLSEVISDPDFFSFFVAACAGVAGMLSLSTAKSGALIGVLISVTTIPAAANVGIAAAYRDGDAWLGSVLQLGINLTSIAVFGTATLFVQRQLYRRRRLRHLSEPGRSAAGLPVSRALRSTQGQSQP
jgi:uncharacterized hydrophobic protein (TIGR00271 family)